MQQPRRLFFGWQTVVLVSPSPFLGTHLLPYSGTMSPHAESSKQHCCSPFGPFLQSTQAEPPPAPAAPPLPPLSTPPEPPTRPPLPPLPPLPLDPPVTKLSSVFSNVPTRQPPTSRPPPITSAIVVRIIRSGLRSSLGLGRYRCAARAHAPSPTFYR